MHPLLAINCLKYGNLNIQVDIPGKTESIFQLNIIAWYDSLSVKDINCRKADFKATKIMSVMYLMDRHM